MKHIFTGKWITDEEFAQLPPRNVFHKQLTPVSLPCQEHRNRHILFRRKFFLETVPENVHLYISADDYYKLYINGTFITQGPAPSYHFQYNYNTVDITRFLREGENLIAIHTLYQGLINRVWQSGDHRHGLILDLCANGSILLSSDETFRTHVHSAYQEMGICGYSTQFLERYDSSAPEVGFQYLEFDDSAWDFARLHQTDDHQLTEQKSHMLVFEKIQPSSFLQEGTRVLMDFGSVYVGTLVVKACGKRGDCITVLCGQEKNEDGTVRYQLRANCVYREEWLLTDGESTLDWFDYKAFRYAELLMPENTEITEVYLLARHYPFTLRAKMKPEFNDSTQLQAIWNLCVHTQKYGVQEVIQDCMEREKGFYLGDGCYTSLTNMILTGDDTMVRKMIDDAFSTEFISDTLMTCMDCSLMQEIAEYPLILVPLALFHYRFTGDREYLRENYQKIIRLLEAYRRRYETDGLLRNLDKWCVVEWPKNFQHGYDVDISEGKICHDAHVSINAYYLHAIRTANRIAEELKTAPYRDIRPLWQAFQTVFYIPDKKLFRDGENTEHVSLVGNSFVYGFRLCPDADFERNFLSMLEEHGIHSLSFFCVFVILAEFARSGHTELVKHSLLNPGAWLRMLREDATTTFEGWGRDTKWNTSLFHLTMSYAALFLADTDHRHLLDI